MRKSIWLALIAAGLLALSPNLHARVRASDRNNNNPQQNQNQNRNQNQNQNSASTTQPFGSGADSPTADDQKQLNKDRAALADAEKDLKVTAAKLKTAFDTSPQQSALLDSVHKAQADYAAQRARVLSGLASNPQYKKALDDRDTLSAQLASDSVPDSTRAELAAHRLEAGNTAAQFESTALAADPKAVTAHATVLDLQAKSAERATEFANSYKKDPAWISANDAVEKAKATLAADQKKLADDMNKATKPKDPNAI